MPDPNSGGCIRKIRHVITSSRKWRWGRTCDLLFWKPNEAHARLESSCPCRGSWIYPGLAQAQASSTPATAPIPRGGRGRGAITAGHGGGSSSSSGPKERPRRRQALRTLRREEGRQGSTRPEVSFPSVGFSSRAFNALRIWSTGITVPLSRRRKAGWFSTAQASDAHEESSARFSPLLRRGWLMTLSGLSSRHKEVSILPERAAESVGVS